MNRAMTFWPVFIYFRCRLYHNVFKWNFYGSSVEVVMSTKHVVLILAVCLKHDICQLFGKHRLANIPEACCKIHDINPLAPGRCGCNLRLVIFKLSSRIDIKIYKPLLEPMLTMIYVTIWRHKTQWVKPQSRWTFFRGCLHHETPPNLEHS